jgi:large repetitive protein
MHTSPHAFLPANRDMKSSKRSFLMRHGHAIVLFIGFLLLSAQAGKAQTASYIYFVPLPETQIHNSFRVLYTSTGTTYHSVISIVPSVSNKVIYFDHWEDGYEANIGLPTQPTTWIFGDGNTGNNGGYSDVVTAGLPIILQNDLVVPNSSSIIKADGGDKIASTKSLSCVRSSWSTKPGTVLADAVEFLNSQAFGTSFQIPVGQNTVSNNMFNLVALHVQASQNATQIQIDRDANGSIDVTATINQGESYQVNGGVMVGATVTSNKPVQVNLITGTAGASYSSRWYNVYPTGLWDSGYYTPVATAVSTALSQVFLYNPTGSAITVTVHTNANLTGTPLTVPSKGNYRYTMPSGSSAYFDSNENFFAIGATDADASNTTWDWGYSLVPEDYLTTSFFVGWGVGAYNSPSQNGNPVWIGTSSLTSTTIVYVDIDGNPGTGPNTDINGNKYDYTVSIAPMGSVRLYDYADNDQTGMHVYTLDGTEIIGAWGEDASTAGAGTPFLDVGTTVAPDPVLRIWKAARLFTDNNSNGLADVTDVIEWKVKVYNQTLQSFPYVILTDVLDSHVTYVPGSTKYNNVSIPDDNSPFTPFPMDETGFNINPLSTGARDSITFNTTFAGPVDITSIPNTVDAINNFGETFKGTAKIPVNNAGVTLCTLTYTGSDYGVAVGFYLENATLYLKLDDADQNLNAGAIDQVQITLYNAGTLDSEILTLIETGNSNGIFTASIPSSNSLGAGADNGILYAEATDVIEATYNDQLFGGTCTASVPVNLPSKIKELYLNTTPALSMDRTLPTGSSAATSAILSSLGTITFDATSTGNTDQGNTSPATVSHTTGTGTNRLMIVGVSVEQDDEGGTTLNVTSVTYGAGANLQTFTKVGEAATSGEAAAEMWYLLNPNSGTANVNVIYSGNEAADAVVVGVTTFSGVNQTTPLDLPATTSTDGTGTAQITVINGATGDLIFGVIAHDDARNITTVTDEGQIARWDVSNSDGTGDGITGGGSTKPGASSVTLGWTLTTNDGTSIIAVPINPAAGNTTATFTQDPAMCSALNTPAGGTVTATLYLTDITGSMPASPAITATVMHGSTTIATLNTASYAAGILTLTGTAAATTIPAGTPVVLTVTTAQSGVTFTISYNAASFRSLVSLPTTDVISMGALEVYSAPYPLGTPITGTINGETVYVRTTVTDPFGAYDIDPDTGTATLMITNPAMATTNVTMSAVGTVTCGKIYEYAWSTPPEQGSFTLSATSREGSENTISSTKATQFIITFTDTGTPCNIEFTTGNNGTNTTSYTGSASYLVCIRVIDMDRNTNALTVQSIPVTVTSNSGSGDTEALILVETGINTGIFTACITGSTTTGTGINDNTLYATAGSNLVATFDDQLNAPDMCTANALILIPVANVVTLAKTLEAPVTGFAAVGDSVIWKIVVSNPGNTTLATINLTDTWDSGCLTYVTATPAPTATTPTGTLTWNETALGGPMVSGTNRIVYVKFLASSGCGPVVNSVSVTGTASAGPVTSGVNLVDPKVTISKVRTSPADPIYATISPVTQVVYSITILNTGNSIIESMPLLDNYSATNLAFSSATIMPNSSGGGQIIWDDLLPGAATLAVGANLTVSITFDVIAGNYPFPVSNNATTGFAAVDVNGLSVPIVTSGVDINIYNLPTANPDEYTMVGNASGSNNVLNGQVVTNDVSPDGFQLTVNTTPVIPPAHASAFTLNSNGTFTYKPVDGFVGDDTFTYEVCDSNGKCVTAVVVIHVLICIDPPARPNSVIKN